MKYTKGFTEVLSGVLVIIILVFLFWAILSYEGPQLYDLQDGSKVTKEFCETLGGYTKSQVIGVIGKGGYIEDTCVLEDLK